MSAPLRAARSDPALLARAAAMAIGPAAHDEIALAAIDHLTMAARSGDDSLHLVVMDLHKALQPCWRPTTATETLDGAHVCMASTAPARDAVGAFMRGLNRTAPSGFRSSRPRHHRDTGRESGW